MTTKKEILEAIRKTCLRCCCGSVKAVNECTTEKSKVMHKDYEICPLYPFRMGIDPNPCRDGNIANLHKNFPAGDRIKDISSVVQVI